MPSLLAPRSRRPLTPYLLLVLGALSSGASGASCLEANAATPDGGTGEGGSHGGSPDTGSPPQHDATVGSMDTGTTGKTDAPTTTTDSGGQPDAAAIPICMNPTAADTACNACTESMCAADVGPALSACATFYTCYTGCACSDMACITGCEGMAPMGCDTPAQNLLSCTKSMCATACAAPDAGTTTDGSSGADAGATCKNPTATQVACGKCEESSCPSTVASEKSQCGAFNDCFDGCDCSDTQCIDACAEAAPMACQTVLESLETCQTGACKSACSGAGTDGGTAAEGGTTTMTIPDCKDPSSAQQSAYATCLTCDQSHCGTYVNAAVASCAAYYSCVGSTDCSSTTAQETCYTTHVTGACYVAISDLGACQDTYCLADCPTE